MAREPRRTRATARLESVSGHAPPPMPGEAELDRPGGQRDQALIEGVAGDADRGEAEGKADQGVQGTSPRAVGGRPEGRSGTGMLSASR